MSVEFVDTNILIYAHERGAGEKYRKSVELLTRLFDSGAGALSIQVLSEFYAVATRKLGVPSEEAEQIVADLGGWVVHSPAHADVLRACRLQRQHKLSWWDALVIQSAIETGSSVLWSEDLNSGQKFGSLTICNPFA
jgi:predicted nucleic acid-binding protein